MQGRTSVWQEHDRVKIIKTQNIKKPLLKIIISDIHEHDIIKTFGAFVSSNDVEYMKKLI